jgi:hypothetical protein
MSFQVVRHEHPNIFVVNRQTYETYRFTVGDDGVLGQPWPRPALDWVLRSAAGGRWRALQARHEPHLFAVDDIAADVAKFRTNGFKTRNEIHSRKSGSSMARKASP